MVGIINLCGSLLWVLNIQTTMTNLAGEVMSIGELNPGIDIEKLKIFECPGGGDCKVGNSNREPACVQRRQISGLMRNSSDKYVIVAAETGRDVQLECHYCHESDESVLPMWFYYEKFLASKRYKEVPLHLAYPPEARKFVVEDDHRLTIRNFTEVDGALYFCQGLEDDATKFNFLVDAVSDLSEMEPKRGSWEDYFKYHQQFVKPLNKELQNEYKDDLKKWFYTKSTVHNYNVSYRWSEWGKCHSCGREHGVRLRTGTCIFSIPTLNSDGEKIGRGAMNFGYIFSCHSTMLKRFLTSKIRKSVNSLLDFIEEVPCESVCNLRGLGAQNIALLLQPEKNEPKHLTILGTLLDSLTLTCADDSKADIVWLKNNEILILPDATNKRSKAMMTYTRNRGGIFFLSLNESDEGNYTCIFDDTLKIIFTLDTQEPLMKSPIPEQWIWIHLGIFSILCFIIWSLLIGFISRLNWRLHQNYQKISNEEELFLKRKHELMEGFEESSV